MSGFLLDTNIPSELIRSAPEPRVKAWIAAQNLASLYISVVSFGELRKSFNLIREDRWKLQHRGQALNLLNVANPSGIATAINFGQINSFRAVCKSQPRSISSPNPQGVQHARNSALPSRRKVIYSLLERPAFAHASPSRLYGQRSSSILNRDRLVLSTTRTRISNR